MYISSVVSKRTANALLKKNIYTTDDFVRFFPKKYYDLTTLYDIQSAPHDIVCAIRGRLISVRMKGEYGKKYIQGEMIDEKTETPFSQYYETARARAVGNGVKVTSVKEDDETEMRMVYDPSHPDADENGYVTYPNVNTVTEMTNLIDATRAYEANTTAFDATKSMVQAALNISK